MKKEIRALIIAVLALVVILVAKQLDVTENNTITTDTENILMNDEVKRDYVPGDIYLGGELDDAYGWTIKRDDNGKHYSEVVLLETTIDDEFINEVRFNEQKNNF